MSLLSPSHCLLRLSTQLYPDGDFSQEMELEGWARNFQPQTSEDQSASQKVAGSSKDTSPLRPSLRIPNTSGSYGSDDSAPESESDMPVKNEFLAGFDSLCITPNFPRYFGKSSSITLLRSAMSAKTKASNGESPRIQRRPEFWSLSPVSDQFLVVHFFLIDLSGNLTVCGLSSENITSLSQIFSLV